MCAQSLVTADGVFVIPGAYPSFTVQKSNSGTSVTGVLMIVGESDSGPSWDLEADVSQNFYGPTEGLPGPRPSTAAVTSSTL